MNTELQVAEVLAAVLVLKPGGSLLVKLFETHTCFTRDLLDLLLLRNSSDGDRGPTNSTSNGSGTCKQGASTTNKNTDVKVVAGFRRLTIVKPVTSRPASSERYLVCEDLAVCDATGARRHDGASSASSPSHSMLIDHLWQLHNSFGDDRKGLLPAPVNSEQAEMLADEVNEELGDDVGIADGTVERRCLSLDHFLRQTNDAILESQIEACGSLLQSAEAISRGDLQGVATRPGGKRKRKRVNRRNDVEEPSGEIAALFRAWGLVHPAKKTATAGGDADGSSMHSSLRSSGTEDDEAQDEDAASRQALGLPLGFGGGGRRRGRT